MSIVRVRFLEDGREAEIPLDILSFKAPKRLTKEEWKKLAERYKGRPLPPEYYADFKPGRIAWCLGSPFELIYTRSGWKRWTDIKIGDEVLTHKGRFRKVIGKYEFSGIHEWIKIYLKWGKSKHWNTALRVTPNHPFLTTSGWKLAKDIKPGEQLISKTFYKCEYCGKPIPIPWKFLDIRHCSRSCATKHQHERMGALFNREALQESIKRRIREGRMRFQANRELARLACAKANKKLAQQRISFPQKLFYEILDKLNVQYEPEFPIKTKDGHTYWADAAIPDLKIDFEIDGSRHHNPEKDGARDKRLRALGWSVIRIDANLLTPRSSQYNPAKVENIVLNTLANEGHLFEDVISTVTKVEKIKYPPSEYRRVCTHAFTLEVEEDHSFMTRLSFSHNSQMHIRGILPEDKEAYDKGKKSFEEIIIGHSLHQDFRIVFQGLSKFVEWVFLEDSMESYFRFNLGKRDPKTGNVAKCLAIVKPSAEEPRGEIEKASEDKMLITEKDAKLIEKYALHEHDVWLAPGDVGATWRGWGVLVTITIGVAQPGIQRPDLHEYFYYPSPDLPKINQKLLNGRIIVKAFKKPRPLWWAWLAVRDPRPMSPWCHVDQGEYYPIKAEKLKYFSKEDYPEWRKREVDCE